MHNAQKSLVISALSGLLFGAGLMLSGMADPARVLAFLTLGPGWDPALAVVMAAALAVAVPGYVLVGRRGTPLPDGALPAPPERRVDRPLVIGALVFGAGWGLAGFCPGPSLIAAGFGLWHALVFVPAMLAGAALVVAGQRAQR